MARQVLDHGVIIPAEYSDDWFEDMSTNLNKLDEVIGSDAGKLSEADVSNVALSGDYDDLTNKPDLKPVATSGDYDDLTDKPSFGVLRMTSETLSNSGSGAISNLNSDSKLAAGDYVLDAALKVFLITAVSDPNYTVGSALFQVTNASSLAAVATSGSYDDLNNLPAYGITRFVNAAITDNSNVAFANISSVDKIKAGDFLLDNAGKMYLIASVDSVNETAAVTTPLTQLAVDSGVMHLSGNETASGIKTFSDDTFIKSLNFTNEVPSPSSSSSSIMPIITTITYGDSSPAVQARLNLRVTADSTKSFYPHENNQYSLGLSSRRWSDFFSYHGNFAGQQQGDEYSGNARTNLTLIANRDTVGQSGCVIDTFRENTTQGTGSHILGFGIKENSIRYEGCRLSWLYDDDNNGYIFSLRPTKQGSNQPIKYELGTSSAKWSTINGLEPSSLGMPDFNNGINISGYISTGSSTNDSYTAPADGYLAIIMSSSSPCGMYVYDYSKGVFMRSNSITDSTYNNVCGVFIPVLKNQTMNIASKATENIVSAYFYPCQGNV